MSIAWQQLAQPSSGSLASFDNAKFWLGSFSPENWLRFSTYENFGRGLVVRSFTPIGFVLAAWGLVASGKLDRLWIGWGAGCALSILGLASKWHHAYYWMVVAPLAAVGVARGLVAAEKVRGPLALMLGSFFLLLCWLQSASTWRTPVEWANLVEAAGAVDALTSEDEPVIAPEAVLHYSGTAGLPTRIRSGRHPACRRRMGIPFARSAPIARFDRVLLDHPFVAVNQDSLDIQFNPSSPVVFRSSSGCGCGFGRRRQRPSSLA